MAEQYKVVANPTVLPSINWYLKHYKSEGVHLNYHRKSRSISHAPILHKLAIFLICKLTNIKTQKISQNNKDNSIYFLVIPLPRSTPQLPSLIKRTLLFSFFRCTTRTDCNQLFHHQRSLVTGQHRWKILSTKLDRWIC